MKARMVGRRAALTRAVPKMGMVDRHGIASAVTVLALLAGCSVERSGLGPRQRDFDASVEIDRPDARVDRSDAGTGPDADTGPKPPGSEKPEPRADAGGDTPSSSEDAGTDAARDRSAPPRDRRDDDRRDEEQRDDDDEEQRDDDDEEQRDDDEAEERS